jgi:hypothetical protein
MGPSSADVSPISGDAEGVQMDASASSRTTGCAGPADRSLTPMAGRKVIVNVASSGKFSGARTITEYANEIWNLKPCAVR